MNICELTYILIMSHENLSDYIDKTGTAHRVMHVDGAIDSFYSATSSLGIEDAYLVEVFYIRFYGNWITTPGPIVRKAKPQGALPNGKTFYEMRYHDFRAYFWYSTMHQNTIVVSHYVKKDWQKLRKKDIKKVGKNWRNLGEGVKKKLKKSDIKKTFKGEIK